MRKVIERVVSTAALIPFAAAMCAASAVAQQNELRSYFYDNGPVLQLDYAWSDCPWECQVVQLVCDDDGIVHLVLADLDGTTVAAWFRFDEPNRPVAELVLDEETIVLSFATLSLGDLNYTWFVALTNGYRNWLSAYAAADATSVRTPTFAIDLPSTPEDRANRAAFVEACLAM